MLFVHIFSAPKTLEELKERFYSIQRALLQKKHTEHELKENSFFTMAYDKRGDEKRRKYLDKLHKRTRGEEMEMLRLVLKHREYSVVSCCVVRL